MTEKMIHNLTEKEFDEVCSVADRALESAKNYQLLYEMLYPLLEASRKLFGAQTRLDEVQALQELRRAQLNFDSLLETKP